ncbi:hypothetical protein Poly51_07300 [Rubripirellula tenax]|uniref:Uncharacterized protein n=1 Tax=Rubripirellula tenax TaxID=2528015 RepID=A0A5C6FKY8_9BACT|nr:hypothetical protein [Rubripirellula tenax]TWU60454.1 hypothetical protein Poly51_07300 [Rubripirellula tenax]
MVRWTRQLAAIAIAMLTSQVGIGDISRLGGSGVRVDMTTRSGGVSSGLIGGADCRVRVNQRAIVLQWTTSAFHHTELPEIQNDASISATVTGSLGVVQVSPRHAVARTNISNRKDEASVAMGIAGNGEVKVDLTVGIDGAQVVEGKHCATVVLTITGN